MDTTQASNDTGAHLSQKDLHLSQRLLMKPLPLWKKLIFSLGFYSWGINNGIIGLFQINFLLEVVELEPTKVGNMMLVKQIYDALTDPIVGVLSDNTNTRFGRRKPWIVTFILPMAVVWVLMWTFNGTILNSDWEVYLYYFGIILLYSTLQTLTTIPYQAMVPDIAPSYNDRMTLLMICQVVGLIGSTSSIFIFSSLIVQFPDDNPESDGTLYNYKKGYVIAAVITSVPILLTMLLAILPISERENLRLKEEKKAKENKLVKVFRTLFNMLKGMKDLITFPPFVAVAVINITGGLSQALVFNNVNLWVKYCIEEESRTNIILTITQVGLIIGVVFFSLFARRVTKKWSLTFGSILGFFIFITLYFIGPGQFRLVLVLMFIEGFGAGSSFVIPPAMLPDVIEMDERRTGIRREALFYSFFLLLEKFSIAITQSASSYALEISGYLSPSQQAEQGTIDNQPESVLLTLRILVFIIPSILKLVIIPLALLFPIICRRYGFNERGEEIANDDPKSKPLIDDDHFSKSSSSLPSA